MAIEADRKDWTWVLSARCPECGFDAPATAPSTVAVSLRRNAVAWAARLVEPDTRARPDDATWSPLEYACHVRDVHRVFGERLALVLDRDDPQFADWDQDLAAEQGGYDAHSPALVATELLAAAADSSARLDGVTGAAWDRPASRSNGSRFTLAGLALYYLHDVEHHLWDVAGRPARLG